MTEEMAYTASNWYWIVGGITNQVFSSKVKAYVPAADAGYVAWLAQNNSPTKIATEEELFDVLAEQAPECLPDNAAGISARQDNLIGKLTVEKVGRVLATALFNHENRIRALAGQGAITKAQFIAALKDLL